MHRLKAIILLMFLGAKAPLLLQAQTIEIYTFTANRLVPDGNAAGLFGPLRRVAADRVGHAARMIGEQNELGGNGGRRELPHHAATLGRLPVPLVIDHNGKFLEPVSTEHPGFKSLLRLIAGGNTWAKLSAPYETSRTGPPRYADVGVLAKALAHAYPERCVWASNWPHPGRNPVPDTADMLDLLLEWADDDATRRRILVDNPAALYGF